MSIYRKDGTTLQSAYDVDGAILDYAYDIDGRLVYLSETHVDYSSYSYITKWNSKGISSTQGFDIYDDKVFWVSKSGNSSVPANCYVWNLSNGTQALDTAYITIYSGHGNNLSFDFPTLYCTSAYTPDVYVNTMTSDYETTLAMQLYINDGCTNCDACIDETNKSILWTFGHTGTASDDPFIVSKWDLSDLTDNGDGRYIPKKLQTVYTPQLTSLYFQGIKFHDGILWYANGYAGTSTQAYVYGINPNTGNVLYSIDCETTSEPEGIAWYPDVQAVGGYALYVGFQGMMMRKYTFAELE